MIYQLIVGDWSHDGHNQSDTLMVEVNAPPGFLDYSNQDSPFYKGCNTLGIADPIKTICEAYEDMWIPIELAKRVFNDNELEPDDFSNDFRADPKSWVEFLLEICKIGDSNFTYTILDYPIIHVGGYGLYS